jgi:signal transduction histidine kinase
MKRVNLQTKLIAKLLLAILGFSLLFIFSLNYYLRALMETVVADKARLIFANLLAVQTYVRESLRPVMYEIVPSQDFVIEAMSTSYVTRKVMSDLNLARDQFSYRRVSLDPRNPQYAAGDMEREFINHFQRDPSEQILSQFRDVNGEECYVTARPVVFKKSCLTCHGKPEDAPAVLLARYGTERGFGRKEGEISGLDMLVVPVEREIAAIRKVAVTFVLVFACGALCILGFNHFFFDRIMVQNIGRLAAVLRSRFPDEADVALPQRPREGDEIDDMVADMERFADHLRAAKRQLSDYAANLESKVEARTAELRQEAEARLSDVQLFLDMLDLFAMGLDRRRLLDRALQVVAGRFKAEVAIFHCFFAMNAHSWPANPIPGSLEPSRRDSLLEGNVIFNPDEAIVPVQAVDSVRGALALRWHEPLDLPAREREVLRAVGCQLGMALENLEAMENILRQKTILESVFEGIADPIFLLDAAGEVLHCNESAHHLMSTLAGDRDHTRRLLGFADLCAESDAVQGPAQHEILLPDGRSLILRAYPLSRYGGVGRNIVYARDNTVEKTMLARLQQGEKSLAVGKLAAGLAHEINNPLGVILCYARLLWDNGASENAQDLDIIIRHTLQAQKVLQDLMRFARPKPENKEAIRLSDAVRFIARVFQLKAAKQNIAIVEAVPGDLPRVLGNAGALEQILSNIVINSMDALEEVESDEQGIIRISGAFSQETGEVALVIADNGPGIPEENLSRVFDPFFSTKEVGKGTGLGLSVTYGLVRDLDGRVEVKNQGGAVFTIYFRAFEEDHAGTPEP